MGKLANKRFILVNISDSVKEEDIKSLFEGMGIKWIQKVIFGNYPNAKISKCFAYVLLGTAVQPYYLPTFLEKIRLANLNGRPVLMFSIFLNQPAEVNRLFDHICQLIGVYDLADLHRAEAITNKLAKIDNKLRQVGIESLIQVLAQATNQGNIDLSLAEIQINGVASARLAEAKQKSKTSHKKRKKRKNDSLIIISTPMGGQPGWKRK
jgi:hypothetical protein